MAASQIVLAPFRAVGGLFKPGSRALLAGDVAELRDRADKHFLAGGLLVVLLFTLVAHILPAIGHPGAAAPVEAFENVLLVLLAITAFYVFVSEMSHVSALREVNPKIDNLANRTTEEVSALASLETAVTNLASKIDVVQGETRTLRSQVSSLREPLAILMPDAETLIGIPNKPSDVEKWLKDLVVHLNNTLFHPAIIRSDWVIDIEYDSSEVDNDGTIMEDIHWNFHLMNISGQTIEFKYTLTAARELPKGVVKSFDIMGPGGIKEFSLSKTSQSESVDNYEVSFPMLAFTRYTVDLKYAQAWPVNRNRPVIHNTFMPRQTSFGDNTLQVSARPSGRILKDVIIMYGDDQIEPRANKYYLASPMLRDQAIEMTLEFQSTAGDC